MAQFEQVGVEAIVKNINTFTKDTEKIAKQIEIIGKVSVNAEAMTKRLTAAQEKAARVASSRAAQAKNQESIARAQAKATEEQAAALEKLGGVATKAGVALLAFAAAGGAIIASSTNLAARVETLGVVTAQLGKNIGLTEPEVRKFEESIKAQGITTQVARQAIAQFIQADIDLANATDLARIAQDAAVIANVNSSESFERLTTVVATGNILMARRLGLNVDFQGSMQRMAESLGKTTDELTQQEIIAARVAEVQRAGANIAGAYAAAMETAGKKMSSLSRLVEESALIIGNFFLPVFTKAIDVVSGLFKSFLSLDKGTQAAIAAILGFATAGAAIVGTALLLVGALIKIKTAAAALQITMALLTGTIAPVAIAIAALIGLGVALVGYSASAKAANAETQAAIDATADTAKTYEQYRKEVIALAKENGKTAVTTDQLANATSRQQQEMVTAGDTVTVLSEAEFELQQRTLELAVANQENALAMQDVTFAIRDAQIESMAMAEALAMQDEAMLASTEALAALDEQMVLFGVSTSRVVEEEMEKFLAAEQALTTEAGQLQAKIAELEGLAYLTDAQKQELEEARTAMGDNVTAVENLADAHRTATAKIILGYAEQAAAALLAAAEAANLAVQQAIAAGEAPEVIADLQTEADRLNAAAQIAVDTVVTFAEQVGLAGETTIQAFVDVQQVFADIESGVITSTFTAVKALEEITAAALEIPTDITVTVTVNTVGDDMPSGGATPQARGGPVSQGGLYLVGEEGPELFVPGQRGVIVPNSLTRKFMDNRGGGTSAITNVENNFTMVNNNPNPDMFSEFAIMESQASGSM